MEIDLTDLFGKTKVLNSMEAERGAARLLQRISNQDIGMEVLPGGSTQFTGEEEEKDYLSYCCFLNSYTGQQILALLEDDDERKRIEL